MRRRGAPGRWLNGLWRLLVALLIVAALLISAGRALLPRIAHYAPAIEQWLTARVGQQLTIGAISGTWQGGPRIVLSDLSLALGAGTPPLRADRALLAINLWASLWHRELRLSEVVIDGLHLYLDPDQLPSGDNAPAGSYRELRQLLLASDLVISLNDTVLHLAQQRGGWRQLPLAELRWQHQAGVVMASGELLGAEDERQQLQLRYQGQLGAEGRLVGRLHLDITGLDIANLWPRAARSQLHSFINGQLWAEMQGLLPQRLSLKLSPSTLVWPQGEGNTLLSVRSGDGLWLRRGEGWHGQLLGLNGELQRQPWTLPKLVAASDGQQWRGYSEQLPLLLSQSLQPLVDGPVAAVLATLQPQGNLGPLWLGADGEGQPTWLAGRFDQLAIAPHDYFPGLTGLSGQLWWRGHSGGARVEASGATVRAGDHFPLDFTLGDSGFTVAIAKQDDSWRIASPDLRVSAPGVNGRLTTLVVIDDNPRLHLYADINVEDAARAPAYYPRLAMPIEVVDYLAAALLDGQAQGAKLLWHGPLDHFPYHDHDGSFEAWVPLRDASFRFDPAWPALTSLSLDLQFRDDGLWMTPGSGRIGATAATAIEAVIPVLDGDSPLTVKAAVTTSGNAARELFAASPLADTVGKALTEISVGGKVSGELALNIPLHAGGEVSSTALVRLRNNKLAIAPLALAFDQVSGDLRFSDAALSLKGAKLQWRGQQLKLDLAGTAEGDDYLLDGQWQASGPLRELLASSDVDHWLHPLAGTIDWQAKLKARLADDPQFSLDLSSSLSGVYSDLPAPFSKEAGPHLPLRVDARSTSSGVALTAELEGQAKASALWQQGQLQQLALAVGGAQLPLLTAGRINLQAVSDNLALDRWLNLLERLPVGEGGEALRFGQATIKANRFSGWGMELGPATLNLYGEADGLVAELQGPDNDWGFNWGERFDLYGSQLTLRTLANASDPLLPPPATSAAELPTVPAISVKLDALQLDTWALGAVELAVVARSDSRPGMAIERLNLSQPHGQLKLQGSWQASGDTVETRLQGALVSKDMGALSKSVGLAGGMQQTQLRIDGQLQWPGGPWDFARARLGGRLTINGSEGVLSDVGTGGSRFIGILSLQSLLRKLRLDFSDVVAKGYYFDSLNADIQIADGVARTDNFSIKGPSMDMLLRGQTALASELIDYQVEVSPKLTSSLPVLTAFAITPVTGLYVLAVSKVLEPVVEVVSRVNFVVTGTLDEPLVAEVGREQRNLEADEWRAVLPEAQREARARGVELPEAEPPLVAAPPQTPSPAPQQVQPKAPAPKATPAPPPPLALPAPISTPLRQADGRADETSPVATDQ